MQAKIEPRVGQPVLQHLFHLLHQAIAGPGVAKVQQRRRPTVGGDARATLDGIEIHRVDVDVDDAGKDVLSGDVDDLPGGLAGQIGLDSGDALAPHPYVDATDASAGDDGATGQKQVKLCVHFPSCRECEMQYYIGIRKRRIRMTARVRVTGSESLSERPGLTSRRSAVLGARRSLWSRICLETFTRLPSCGVGDRVDQSAARSSVSFSIRCCPETRGEHPSHGRHEPLKHRCRPLSPTPAQRLEHGQAQPLRDL